jgi:hypothetical protein
MVPLLAWDQPVGLVSIGEFFTPNCSKLRDPAIQITSANKLLPILGDTQSREMPVLREEQVEGVLTAVQHLARIIPTNSLSTLCERNNFMDMPERIDHFSVRSPRGETKINPSPQAFAAFGHSFPPTHMLSYSYEDCRDPPAVPRTDAGKKCGTIPVPALGPGMRSPTAVRAEPMKGKYHTNPTRPLFSIRKHNESQSQAKRGQSGRDGCYTMSNRRAPLQPGHRPSMANPRGGGLRSRRQATSPRHEALCPESMTQTTIRTQLVLCFQQKRTTSQAQAKRRPLRN